MTGCAQPAVVNILCRPKELTGKEVHLILDSLGLADEYMTHHAEEILELFDWMGLEADFQSITMDRFKGLLTDALPSVGVGSI